ncbi:5'/3'-nucleotidase SurE [Stratiformator vulcanicus]|uniref:5'-nucleotidase n=1 Tax=Stratiformator vulcanicus TaxID=2527980 RepID=A0A517R0E0_9PLAN|nr:5'/3'-nucleotidase SurE [Stratiformator vulcanicus]QDT37365.1 5'-nucleotidase SurE [Stratiformator vulcanicus]
MKFLLTNDDGYDAPGLALLRRAAEQFGAVTSVAPLEHHSGCGHRVTTDRELSLVDRGSGDFSLDGTPADCVRIGLSHVASDAEWVLAGLNDGGNLGVDTYISGTVAAAREAVLMGRPAIAFSRFKRGRSNEWERLNDFLPGVLERLRDRPLPSGHLWNVNFPDLEDLSSETRMVDCHLEPAHLPIDFTRKGDAFRYRGVYSERPQTPGSDVAVCFAGNIAVSLIPVLAAPMSTPGHEAKFEPGKQS